MSRGQTVNRESGAEHQPRVALVHDWLTGMRGGEKALEVLCDLYPDAEILTLVHVTGSVLICPQDCEVAYWPEK